MATKGKKRRVVGRRINFRSLFCAPVNELGVVYLFGVLHDAFDFKIESIQAGFPDCLALRKISENRYEQIRIEFEFESLSFKAHGHDPSAVDAIVCWVHNWPQCPEDIEVIELSSLLEDTEVIREQVKVKKKLNDWQRFCQEKRLEGYVFSEIAKMWKERKTDE